MKAMLVTLGIFLTGCAGLPEADNLRSTAAQAADAALDSAIWRVCATPTMGALNRRFPAGSDVRERYEAFCAEVGR